LQNQNFATRISCGDHARRTTTLIDMDQGPEHHCLQHFI
jgi:hypothetical protein